jgi:hypothetical protein
MRNQITGASSEIFTKEELIKTTINSINRWPGVYLLGNFTYGGEINKKRYWCRW